MEIATGRVEVMAPSPRGLSLRRNFAWTVAGNVTYAACQWGMLVTLAKLGSPEMVGQFALGLAIAAPAILLSGLALRAVLATDVQLEFNFQDYLGLRIISTLIAFLTIAVIALAANYRWQTTCVVVVVGCAKSVESVSDILYGFFQKYEHLDRIAIALILRGAGSVAIFGLLIWATGRVVWAVIGLTAWWSTVLFLYELKTARVLLESFGTQGECIAPSWNSARLRRLAWLTFPLGLVAVLVNLNTNIPRYFVEHYLGEAALGYFAALAYVMVAGFTVIGAMGQSAAPRLARLYSSDRVSFVRLLGKMVLLAVGIGGTGILMAALWGKPLLTLLYRREYAEYSAVFMWIMIAAAINYVASMLGCGMTAARIFRAQVPIFVATGIAILVTCALLIRSFGMMAAAWALTVGQCVAALGAGGIVLWAVIGNSGTEGERAQ